MSTFFEVGITAAHGGFGEYDCSAIEGEGWANRQDLIEECQGNISGTLYELGVDALPSGMEDIRGRIHAEPPWIYAYTNEAGDAHYFGVRELP